MINNVLEQEKAYDKLYEADQISVYDFHITNDPLTRFLRDGRLTKGIKLLEKNNPDFLNWSVLVTCGGVGGEGIFLKKYGFKDITVSDISENSLKICNIFDPSLKTIKLDGEDLDLADKSYDLVISQDGLHHLPRPISGFTEMLRVARKAVIVIESYDSLVGSIMGTQWELTGDAVNHVFRWNKRLINQVVKCYVLKNFKKITVLRYWDHSIMLLKVVNKFPKRMQYRIAKLLMSSLAPLNGLGNMMTTVVEL